MANRPALVSQTEVKRTVAGVLDAGLRIDRVEVDYRAGKVILIVDGEGLAKPVPTGWEDVE